ncbi:hypothetical protein ACQEU6_06980 [Spirillospora sp. CA-108201]
MVAVRPLGEIDALDALSVVTVDRPIIVTTRRRSENVFGHRLSIADEIGHLPPAHRLWRARHGHRERG